MIKTEIIEIDGIQYKRTYSDEGYLIERDGVRYGDAVDPIDTERQYTETDEKIELPKEEETT